MWVTKLLISPVKKRIFCPKTTKFGPKLAFLVNLGQATQAYSMSCWWVSWWLWRAGCISQDTYLLYCIFCFFQSLYLRQCIGKRWKILPRDPEQGTLARNILIHKLKTFSYLQIILIHKLKTVPYSQIIRITIRKKNKSS